MTSPVPSDERPRHGIRIPARIGSRGLLRLWTLAFVGATGFGVLGVLVHYFSGHAGGMPRPFTNSLQTLIDWYVWALISPPIVLFAQRFRIRRERWRSGVALHLALGTGVAFVELAIFLTLARGYMGLIGVTLERSWLQGYALTAGSWLPTALLIYLIIVIAVHAVDYAQRYRMQELQASRLETQLVQSQLAALKAQLHPHFLFNTLHTIGVFMREGRRDEGVRMIAGLADLLRHALDHGARQLVPLREELDFIENYLAIERIRLGDRLEVSMRIDPEVLDAPLPSMILQPIVENAIRHGIAPHARQGWIGIRACQVDGRLHVEIVDSGTGFPEKEPLFGRENIGLRNTRDRLIRHYGGEGRLLTGTAAGGGAQVTLVIPWQQSSVIRSVRPGAAARGL